MPQVADRKTPPFQVRPYSVVDLTADTVALDLLLIVGSWVDVEALLGCSENLTYPVQNVGKKGCEHRSSR